MKYPRLNLGQQHPRQVAYLLRDHSFSSQLEYSLFCIFNTTLFNFVLGPHSVMDRNYLWFCTQQSLLVLRGPYGILKMEAGPAWSGECKANTLPTVISLQSLISFQKGIIAKEVRWGKEQGVYLNILCLVLWARQIQFGNWDPHSAIRVTSAVFGNDQGYT